MLGFTRERVMRGIGRHGAIRLALALALCGALPLVQAAQIVPAGGATYVYNGLFDLACTDLTVNGTLDIGTGTYVKVRNVVVGQNGVLQGNGTINYSGTLSSSGTVGPGVKLAVSAACVPASVAQPIPALENSMLAALAALLLLLSGLVMRDKLVLRHRGGSKGADK